MIYVGFELSPFKYSFAVAIKSLTSSVTENYVSHHVLSLVLRGREVPGVLCADPARPEDRVRRGHPSRALPSTSKEKGEKVYHVLRRKHFNNTASPWTTTTTTSLRGWERKLERMSVYCWDCFLYIYVSKWYWEQDQYFISFSFTITE